MSIGAWVASRVARRDAMSLVEGHLTADLRLKAMQNPHGMGVLVYAPKTRTREGVRRLHCWLVVDGEAFALNGASKGVTPDLRWPREFGHDWHRLTGLNPYRPPVDTLWPDLHLQ